jgi:hypothetical protein
LPEQQELLLEDPKLPAKEISSGLGISQKEFIECFKNVRPAQGSNPNTAKVHANKKAPKFSKLRSFFVYFHIMRLGGI